MNDKVNTVIKKPSKWLMATEGPRALMELAAFVLSKPILRRRLRGDQHPVLVLPGFMSSDRSTRPLRNFLNKIDYQAYPWKLGINIGHPRFVEQLVANVEQLFNEHGRRISLLGWSLGGIYAREVARQCPDKIRQVITLGAPFAGINQPNNVSWIYTMLTGRSVKDIDEKLLSEILVAPPVPMTAIYSKADGIVPWQYCREAEEGPLTQNVEVGGSHCGLGFNPVVVWCIADRLSLQRHQWKPFRPGWLEQFLFPKMAF